MNDWYMKKPCDKCPYRRDVKPYLTPERGEELAFHAQNPFNSFPCHLTTVSDEEFGGDGSENVAIETSRECAGLLTLVYNEDGSLPDKSFEPSDLVYSDAWDMMNAYAEQD